MSIFRDYPQLYKSLSDFYTHLAAVPRFQEIHQTLDQFLDNDAASACYEELMGLEEELHQKQHDGEITEADLARYREINERLQQMPHAEEFFNAQQEMEEINMEIVNFIGLAIDQGEVPSLDELEEAGDSCGCDCGCH